MRLKKEVTTRRGTASRTAVYAGLAVGLAIAVPISLSLRRPAAGHSVPAPQAFAPPAALAPPVDPVEEARKQRMAGLQALLDEEAAKINGVAHVHVRLEDGSQAGVLADYPVDPASVIKVPVMVALYDAWESKVFKRTAADQRRLRRMITHSKNIPTNELIDKLGMERINAWLTRNGYVQTLVQARILDPSYTMTNVTTAEECTRLLDQILRGQVVSRPASDEMRRLLLAQRWRERVPALLPKEAVCGNKTGTMSNLLHDLAFVEAPNGVRYTIAVFIERADRAACKSEAIAALSRRVYDYLTATAPPDTGGRLSPSQPRVTVPGGTWAWRSESGGRVTATR
jgi:beta-lactamase class A